MARSFLLLCIVLQIGDSFRKKQVKSCSDTDLSMPPCEDASSLLQSSQRPMLHSEMMKVDPPTLPNKVPPPSQGFGSHSITWGLALGIFLIGPDHLGTLMALSTISSTLTSFKVGFAWGIGHSIGMLLIVPLFYVFKMLSTKASGWDKETWEYWGDYFIGASMILISVYFVLYEHRYVEKKEDGTTSVKECTCCGHSAEATLSGAAGHDIDQGDQDVGETCLLCGDEQGFSIRDFSPKHIKAHKNCNQKENQNTLMEARQPQDRQPRDSQLAGRDLKGAMLGVVQGLCCPTGLVALGFMGRVSTHASMPSLVAFTAVFIFASGLGSGAIAAGWAWLLRKGSSTCISARLMYLTCCVAIGCFGLLWMVANAAGFLNQINYTDNYLEQVQHRIGF